MSTGEPEQPVRPEDTQVVHEGFLEWNPFESLRDAWMRIPATTREPLRSAIVSSAFTVYSVVQPMITSCTSEPVLVAAGYCRDPHSTLAYLGAHWWSIVTGIIVNPAPAYRARQGYVAAKPPDPQAPG